MLDSRLLHGRVASFGSGRGTVIGTIAAAHRCHRQRSNRARHRHPPIVAGFPCVAQESGSRAIRRCCDDRGSARCAPDATATGGTCVEGAQNPQGCPHWRGDRRRLVADAHDERSLHRRATLELRGQGGRAFWLVRCGGGLATEVVYRLGLTSRIGCLTRANRRSYFDRITSHA